MPNCLVPGGWPKTEEYDQIMTLRTDKDLKSKNVRGKTIYILAKDMDSKENLKSKPKKNWLEKGLFFWVTLIQAVVSKTLRLFYKIFFFLQNISTLKKSASSYYYEPRKPGGP